MLSEVFRQTSACRGSRRLIRLTRRWPLRTINRGCCCGSTASCQWRRCAIVQSLAARNPKSGPACGRRRSRLTCITFYGRAPRARQCSRLRRMGPAPVIRPADTHDGKTQSRRRGVQSHRGCAGALMVEELSLVELLELTRPLGVRALRAADTRTQHPSRRRMTPALAIVSPASRAGRAGAIRRSRRAGPNGRAGLRILRGRCRRA